MSTEAPERDTTSASSLPARTGALVGPSVYRQMDSDRLALIKATVARGVDDVYVASFLELAAKYDLDPFANEIWVSQGRKRDGGDPKILIMVGRDGLRKIARRNGLWMDGDIVHENDDLRVVRAANGQRTIEHAYSPTGDRGAVIGAWAEVRRGAATGMPMGYFYAPIGEYKPSSGSAFSPWSKQESVMILAAAERQALRQATPLSGLLVEGEDDSVRALTTGEQPDQVADEPGLGDGFWDSLAVSESVANDLRMMTAGWDTARVQMTLLGRDGEGLVALRDEMLREWGTEVGLDDPSSEPEPEREGLDERETVVEPDAPERLDEDASPERVERDAEVELLRRRLAGIEAALSMAGDGADAEQMVSDLGAEADAIEAELRSLGEDV